jgi:hypothetical protein
MTKEQVCINIKAPKMEHNTKTLMKQCKKPQVLIINHRIMEEKTNLVCYKLGHNICED